MHLFAYGTLVFEDIWQLIVGRVVQSRAATLRGYEVRRAEGDLYPVMFESEVSDESSAIENVPGFVYYDLTESEFQRLDDYESGLYYRRTVLPLLEDGTVIRCDSYVLPQRNLQYASELPWTQQWFAQHAKQRYMQRLLH
ncbi:gamma-glutamylcyclotransferase family protein [Adhaeretor mobilis]|uniref:Putative gamma-glutamylcyclotransferase n=1 Tax=Adhaeretor mobilis TaxID=1930276 RepID=A0A517MWY0_9BACT|nr:gamma-glutamylcyclotransferase family protein [Adhaeretor mobilis]QDS99382.1 AIG2-like family protein [Adhaeretor mobilis]